MIHYETHTMKDPRIPFIFNYMHNRKNYLSCGCNWHENIEIWLITEGRGIIQNDEEHIPVEAGDIVVINANCLHTISSREAMDYLCLIIDRSFLLANYIESNQIRFDTLIRDEEISRLLKNFGEEYFAEDKAYRIPSMRAHVLQIVTLLCRKYGTQEKQPRTDSRMLSAIKQAIGLIRSESDRDFSLEEIAGFVGLSKYYFAREFRRITEYSVFSYINLVRCEKAKTLLSEQDVGIGEIGLSCGFANQSYFARTFKTYVGLSPSQYREKYRTRTRK